MPSTTTNYGLTKPGTTDNADITVIDTDLDQIDTQMKANADAAAAASSSASTNATNLTNHKNNTSNPHSVTAAQAGAVANAGSAVSMQAGTSASKPAAGTAGRIYIETDTGRIMRDNGTAWGVIGVLAASEVTISDSNFTSTNVQGALDELFQNVSNGKTQIASAITGMGQAASGSDTFAQLASAIQAISDDANAGTGDVLSPKTFYQGGSKKTGTMPENGAVGGTLTAPGTINIPAGHTSGGSVTANYLKAAGSAGAAQVLSGYSASNDSGEFSGSMPNNGAVGGTITSQGGSISIPAGYTPGGSIAANFSNLVAGNVLNGVDIGGVVGNVLPLKTANGTQTTSSTTSNYVMANGGTSSAATLSISGLGFTPKYIVVQMSSGWISIYSESFDFGQGQTDSAPFFVQATNGSSLYFANQSPAVIGNGNFSIPVTLTSNNCKWFAMGS